MKDLLREVDCPEPLQREIQGHSLNDPADGYGKGPSLPALGKSLRIAATRLLIV